jgi:hypothetical protein
MKKKPEQNKLVQMGRLRGGRPSVKFKSKKDYNRQKQKKFEINLCFCQIFYQENYPSYDINHSQKVRTPH